MYYRAYWYFYNRSYDYCIRDLEALYTVHKDTYTAIPSGELEMRLLLGIAYAQSGKVSKGINWVLNLMETYKDQPHLKGFYDHFCLGILYYKNNQFDLTEAEFKKQLLIHDTFADTYFYLGLIKEKEAKPVAAQGYFKQALARMNREHGGYSINFFTEFNTTKEDVEKKIIN